MRRLLTITLLGYIFVSLFGINMTMAMHKDGKMANCPFMMSSSSSFCQMGVLEHMRMWQDMFAAALTQTQFTSILFVVIFVAITFMLAQFTLAPPVTSIFKRYKKEHPDIEIFNELSLAFSKGILHPRVYA